MLRSLVCLAMMVFALLCTAQSITPEVQSTSGEYFTSASATLSWTMGETVVTTETGTTAIVTQGFQQPDEKLVGVEEVEMLEVLIYPNPTADILNLELEETAEYNVQIVDAKGALVIDETHNDCCFEINIEGLTPGNYTVNLYSSDELLGFAKIQKL